MTTIVLSSHPLADRLSYKADVLRGLVERGCEVVLLYAGTGAGAYWRELRRRNPAEVARRAGRLLGRKRGAGPAQRAPLREVARTIGVRVETVPALSAPSCLALVERLRPVLVHNLSSLYVPGAFLDASGHRVVGAHYAELPRLRGGDTIRWSILLGAPLMVTHFLLRRELDLGDILRWTPVPVERGDDVDRLRRKCQEASAAGHLAVAEAALAGTLEPVPQREEEGSMFFRMGAVLRGEVDTILAEGRYPLYAGDAAEVRG
jgi:methionyl-tRNA formyltransferase